MQLFVVILVLSVTLVALRVSDSLLLGQLTRVAIDICSWHS